MLQLNEAFERTKKDLKFKATLAELDEIFYIKDEILEKGYVSEQFSRQLSGRITDLYQRVYAFLHGIIVPNPNSMLSLQEHQLFTDDDKADIMQLMARIAEMTSRSWLIGLNKDKTAEGKFIDDSLALWNAHVQKYASMMMKKINKNWLEKSKTKPKPAKSETAFG